MLNSTNTQLSIALFQKTSELLQPITINNIDNTMVVSFIVKIAESGLFLFSLCISIFSIYFSLFYFQNQGQYQSDKIMLSHNRSHQMTQSQNHMTHGRRQKVLEEQHHTICEIHVNFKDIYMVIQGRLEIACMDHQILVYKVDNPVQSSLLSSLI